MALFHYYPNSNKISDIDIEKLQIENFPSDDGFENDSDLNKIAKAIVIVLHPKLVNKSDIMKFVMTIMTLSFNGHF